MFYNDFAPGEVLVYLRKSRTDDPTLDVTEILARHETILDEWAERCVGCKIAEENKYREVVSGETIDNRPELLKLLRRIESPQIKAVLVVEIQRLGRPDLEDIGRLSKIFRYTNTVVITPIKTFDLNNEYDREIFERELMRGNEYLEYSKKIMHRGIMLSVQQGNFVGNKPPYGYDKHIIYEGKKKCHTLKFNEVEADVVRMIFDMYVHQNIGPGVLARKLTDMGAPTRSGGAWSVSALKSILTNEHYIGKVRFNCRKTVTTVENGEIKKSRPRQKAGEYLLFDGKHPAIIDEDTFYAAVAKWGRTAKNNKKTKVRNPLAGLIYCQCGRAMSLRTHIKNGVERCAPRLMCDGQVYCNTSSCLYSEILERVREILKQAIADFEIHIKNDDNAMQDELEEHIKRLTLRLQELESKELKLWEKYANDEIPKDVFYKLLENIKKEKESLEKALEETSKLKSTHINYEEQLRKFSDALSALDDPNISAEAKNNMLKACIERIYYRREKSIRATNPNPTGPRNWITQPIELDVHLRIF